MRARIPSNDDEFLLVERLDLEPLSRSPPFVARRLFLGDDAFVTATCRKLQRLFARQVELLRHTHSGGRAAEELLQRGAAIFVSLLPQIVTIQPDEIEHENEFALRALLQELKSWRTSIVEGHDFTVEHRVFDFDLGHGIGDHRKPRREIELVAAPHRKAAADDCRDRAETVVLHLVRPVGIVGRRRIGKRGQHRREHFAQ